MKGKKALIIEDQHHVFSLLKEILSLRGFDSVEVAYNGKEGVDKYHQVQPDLVIMDLEMPVMNGYESSKTIKAFDPGARIILLTGIPDAPLAKKTLEEGHVSQILSKPFELEQFFEAIELSSQ